jgi:hypothetical protein
MAEQRIETSADRDRGWNPYLAGALSGVVGVLSGWIAGNYLGASTTFVRSAGMLERLIARHGGHVRAQTFPSGGCEDEVGR